MAELSPELVERMREAHKAWWSGICRQGDPIRRPNLSYEAFEAGYRAALEASGHAELCRAFERLVDNINEFGVVTDVLRLNEAVEALAKHGGSHGR